MYNTTIGLEIHVELKTKTKIFCGCPNEFGGEPNTHCCPICAGLPGTLPMLNKQAIEYAVKAGLALGCEISKYCKWDRKNYFYPDLPKAWQTSQFDLPICIGGHVDFMVEGEKHTCRLNHIHLEEDAGKLIHEGGVTRVDNNRGGVPLIEIVTEPDLHSADEAVAFLEELRNILKYTGVSDVKMQEGSMRCDVNLSIAKEGEPLGTRTETKNLNSFRSVLHSIKYERARQEEVLENGGKIKQETRRWDDAKGEGYGMRSKENANDYRYFPEPDVMPVVMSDEEVERIRKTIPMLPSERKKIYVNEYKLPEYDADILISDIDIATLFDEAVKLGANPKKASNFIMGDVLRLGKEANSEEITIGITGNQLYELLKLVEDNVVSLAAVSKDMLPKLWLSDEKPSELVDKLGLRQSNDTSEIEEIVKDIMAKNEKVVNDYRSGNTKVRSFFVGQTMKATKGKANPKIVNEVLSKLL